MIFPTCQGEVTIKIVYSGPSLGGFEGPRRACSNAGMKDLRCRMRWLIGVATKITPFLMITMDAADLVIVDRQLSQKAGLHLLLDWAAPIVIQSLALSLSQ